MNLNDTRDSAEYKINNDKQREIISNIYIGDCIRQLNITLENINKNLEKIANKDFNVNTNNYTTQVPNFHDVKKLINDHAIIGSNNTKNFPKC